MNPRLSRGITAVKWLGWTASLLSLTFSYAFAQLSEEQCEELMMEFGLEECPTNLTPPGIIFPTPENYGSDETIHTTIRSGTGIPELAVTPREETGAIRFEVNTPSGLIPLLIQPADPGLSLMPPPPAEPRPSWPASRRGPDGRGRRAPVWDRPRVPRASRRRRRR